MCPQPVLCSQCWAFSPCHVRLGAAGAGGSGLVRLELASRRLSSLQAQASGAGDADPGRAGGRTMVQAAPPPVPTCG